MSDSITITGSQAGAVVLGIMGTFFLLFTAIRVFCYTLQALGYYKLAQNRELDHTWLAWVPICQEYLLGELLDKEVWRFGYANWILPIGNITVIILNYVALNSNNDYLWLFVIVLSFIFMTYCLTALHRLYKIYSDSAVLFLVLSIIFYFLIPVLIFIIRNNQPKPLVKQT